MVDSHSLNSIASITSAFSFKSGDISGTAAKTSDEKNGQGSEYFQMNGEEQQVVPQGQMYVDRSAQLRATLNSLAVMNMANMLANKRKKELIDETIAKDTKIDDEFKDIKIEDATDEDLLNDFDDEELEQT